MPLGAQASQGGQPTLSVLAPRDNCSPCLPAQIPHTPAHSTTTLTPPQLTCGGAWLTSDTSAHSVVVSRLVVEGKGGGGGRCCSPSAQREHAQPCQVHVSRAAGLGRGNWGCERPRARIVRGMQQDFGGGSSAWRSGSVVARRCVLGVVCSRGFRGVGSSAWRSGSVVACRCVLGVVCILLACGWRIQGAACTAHWLRHSELLLSRWDCTYRLYRGVLELHRQTKPECPVP